MKDEQLVLYSAQPNVAVEAARWLERACERMGYAGPRMEKLTLCTLEAVNNSIEHAYRFTPGNIQISVNSDADAITVTVSDYGRRLPAQPTTHCPSLLDARGRGSWIMQQWCDNVYHKFFDGMQHVVLQQRLHAEADQDTLKQASPQLGEHS